MTKFLKYTAYVIALLILLAIIAIVLLVTFVSPNRFKPMIVEQVTKYTGRQLTMDGDLSWTFFPHFGVKAGHMTLGNPAHFQQKTFAEISSFTLGVKLLPLLHRRIESDGISLNGLKLALIKNAQGEKNWVFTPTVSQPGAPSTDSDTSAKTAGLGLAVSNISLSDANVTYTDELEKQNYTLTDFDFEAKDIKLNESFPLKTSFDFSGNKSAISGHISLTSRLMLNLDTQQYRINDIDFSAKLNQADKKLNLDLAGNIVADMAQHQVQWADLTGHLANLSLSGKVKVIHLDASALTVGHLEIPSFDLKETLQTFGQKADALQSAKDTRASVDFSATRGSVNVLSTVKIDTLKAAKLTLTKVAAKASFENGILAVSPITAQLYQGNLTANAKVNMSTAVPQIALQVKLANVQAEPLLHDLGGEKQKIGIIGTGNLGFQVITSGAEQQVIMRNLNGTGQFSFNNGSITGIDLGYLVDNTYSFLKKRASTATNTDKTGFGNLTGTFMIQNGVLTNNDLYSDSPRFITNGKGTINLVDKKLDYTLQTTVKKRSADQKDDLQDLYGIAVPVTISGSFANPQIGLDTRAISQAIAQYQMQRVKGNVQKKIQEQIENKIGQKLPAQASELLGNLLGP